jgi:hypothetical protein
MESVREKIWLVVQKLKPHPPPDLPLEGGGIKKVTPLEGGGVKKDPSSDILSPSRGAAERRWGK